MNSRVLITLEFDKICRELQGYAASEMGFKAAGLLRPAACLADVQRMLAETVEADAIIRRTGKNPVDSFPDVRNILQHIHAVLALTPVELLRTRQCLRACRNARESLEECETEPILSALSKRLPSYRQIEEEIGRCILSEEEIADVASPELSSIRRRMRLTNEKVREKLNAMIRSTSIQKYLQEPIITVRDGRYVIPVKSDFRAQIPGLVHDTSGSGATLFIEPAAAVELGNEYRKLQSEEQEEIARILADLTARVDPVSEELLGGMEILSKIDVVFAKAAYARDLHAVCPKMNDRGYIRILQGRHPLLDRETVVPIDLWIGDTFKTLIVTGPNTGGKTVTLKTVGLFSVMAMSGLFVPGDQGTELSFFSEVFADIGDEQSIEQSLSTFSSHMKNIVSILENADGGSLVLLDELGAGTDPVEGAALAQAILENLTEKDTRTIATTHYSEIKAFAMTHEGMQNACMEFDVDKLCPTYHLYIGIPGKSNAFEISRRLGLSDQVISSAEEYLEKEDIAFEDVIAGAEKARRDAETARELAERELEKAEAIHTALEKEKSKLEQERARLRESAKEEARNLVRETRLRMETLISQLRSQAGHDSRATERSIQNARDGLRKTETELSERMDRTLDREGDLKQVVPGQSVHIISLNQDATVLKFDPLKKTVSVQAGIVKMTVPLSDLSEKKKDGEKKQSAGFRAELHQGDRSFLELDLRGKTVDEAVVEIDRFIDDAGLAGIGVISLIHGKGTGALREGVQAYLRHNPRVKSFRMGSYGEGDAGVTIVTLK